MMVEWLELGGLLKSVNSGLNPRNNFVLNEDGACNFYVTVKEITTGKIRFNDKTDKVTDAALKIIQNRSNLEMGDVLVSGIGTIGKVAIVDIPCDNWNCSESVLLLKVKKEKILPKYLMYILSGERVQRIWEKESVGSTLKGIRKAALVKMQIPVPPICEQEIIVKKLDAFTCLIEKLDEEIELRKQQFSFYLENIIFDDENSNSLSDYAFMGKGRISADKLSFDNYVSVENLLKNKAGRRDAETIPSEGNWLAYSTEDVLIGNIRPYLRKIWFADRNGGTNGDVVVVRSKDKNQLQPRFLYYLLSSEKFFNYYSSSVKDGKMPRGDKGKLLDFAFPYKEKDIQSSLIEKFDTMNTLISKLEEERDLRQKQYEYYREKLLTFE